jgi:hypothetical protein
VDGIEPPAGLSLGAARGVAEQLFQFVSENASALNQCGPGDSGKDYAYDMEMLRFAIQRHYAANQLTPNAYVSRPRYQVV